MDRFNKLKSRQEKPRFWLDYKAVCKSTTVDQFVAFDCETTGLDPKKDRLLSIGAIKFSSDRIYVNQSIELLIKQDDVDEKSVIIHGILPNDAAEAPLSEEAAVIKFLEFIENAILVGHHIRFDVAMINHALKRLNLGKLKNKTQDTNSIFKKKHHYPHEQNISLDDLCEKFSIKAANRHTALGDAYLTAISYQRLVAL